MKLRIDINDIDSSRIRKVKLNTKRVPVNKKEKEILRNNLFKVKHIDDDILFDETQNSNGHYVLTVALNPKTGNVAVAELNSIVNDDNEIIKLKRINKGYIKPIEPNDIQGNTKRNGISIDLYINNVKENRELKLMDLKNIKKEIIISESVQGEFADFLFNNMVHKKISQLNREKTKDMRKIK